MSILAPVVSGVLACGGRSGPAMDGGESTDTGQFLPAATPACIIGWWFGASAACQLTACKDDIPPPPECAFSDCQAVSYFGFETNQLLAEGTLTWSPAQQQFSRVVGSDNNRWAIEDAGIATFFPGDGGMIGSKPSNGQCQGNVLLFDFGQYSRQLPPLSTALQNAWADGGWEAVRY
jgi:hypothetical protein